jgi:uncharacterized protein YlxW (UPF0749 family)
MKFARNISITLICVILGIIISWQYQSIVNNSKAAGLENLRTEQVKDQLLEEKKITEDLQKKIEELQTENQKYESIIGNRDEESQKLMDDLEKFRTVAGLTTVKGKGVVIKLSKSIDDVYEEDILKVLNELRAADAQAISINEERVTAMTEIRDTTSYFMINGRQIQPPIVIKAIGDPANLENSLKMANGVYEKLKRYIEVDIKKNDDITINKIKDDGTAIKIDKLIPVTNK